MLAERRKSSVMRIFRQTIGLTVAALLVAAPVSAGAGTAQFRSAEDALQQGIGAYTGGYYEMAIPALEVAAAKNLFLARYYLARIYADNQSAHTDHAKAYFLYQQLANEGGLPPLAVVVPMVLASAGVTLLAARNLALGLVAAVVAALAYTLWPQFIGTRRPR